MVLVSITSMGKKWELLNSFWMLWVLMIFGLTNYIAFFYIGAKLKSKKYVIAGFVYMILTFQYFFVNERYDIDTWQFDVSLTICLASWIISIIHAVSMRRIYLLTLEARAKGESVPQRKEIIPTKAMVEKAQETGGRMKLDELAPPQVVKVNEATAEQLSRIPSITALLAQEIVNERSEHGAYQSFEQFINRLQLKPHIIIKAKPFLLFPNTFDGSRQSSPQDSQAQSRKGRVVDY